LLQLLIEILSAKRWITDYFAEIYLQFLSLAIRKIVQPIQSSSQQDLIKI